jgi:hypothetical protein
MVAIRSIAQAALVAACAAGGMVSIQAYMSSKTKAPLVSAVSKMQAIPRAEAIALKRSAERALENIRMLSPIYPTIKYTAAQLAPSATTNPLRAKKVVRSTRNAPLQIAYAPKPAGYIY